MSTLLETTDAMVWAEEFCRIFHGCVITNSPGLLIESPLDDGPSEVDEGTMVGWFANAMAVAEREATQKLCPHPTTERSELSEDLVTCVRCGKIWSRA
jgi:hypothetical protein